MVVGGESTLLQIFGPVGVIVLYLVYEFRFGRVAKFQATLSAIAAAVLALSKHVDGVDEEAVARELPDAVITTRHLYADDGEAEQAAVDELIEVVRERAEELNEQEDDNNQ